MRNLLIAIGIFAVVVALARVFFWLRGGRGGLTEKTIDRTEQQAFRLLRAGDAWEAEQLLQKLVDAAAGQHGPRSRMAGKALFAQATFFMALKDHPRAVAAMRKACEIDATDKRSQKDRMTYQMNLGEFLSRMGEHNEAEQVLRESLDERRRFYGENHSGYAYGLESLGQVLLRGGRADEALELLEQAIRIDEAASNPHLAYDVALKAVALKSRAESSGQGGLPDWPRLAPQVRSGVVQVCHELSDSFEPQIMLAVYQDLQGRLDQAPTSGGFDTLNVAIAITNMARQAGDHETRIAAFGRAIELLADDKEQLVGAWMGLAAAYGDAGQTESAENAYEKSVAIANETQSPRHVSQALRNYAIYLAETERIDEAQAMHEQAVEAGRQSGDSEMLGRALCAQGVFLQHQKKFDEAVRLLEESLTLLPPAHPDALCAQSHLPAAKAKESCGCEAFHGEALAEMLRKLVIDRAPAGLVEQVDVDLSNQEAPISVKGSRELTEQEARQLYDAVQNALGELRRRMSAMGYDK